MTRVFAFVLLLFCVWFAAPAPAQACIGLGCNCTVSAQPTAFGNYDPFASSPDETAGEVTVTCGAQVAIGFSYDVKLSAGGSGDVMARRMTSGGNTLSYQLYKDAGYAVVWGNTNGSGVGYISESYTLTISLLSRTIHYPVTARAPARQNVRPGDYSDTITVTVDF